MAGAPKFAGLTPARWQEVSNALRDSTLTAQGFVERAFTFPEVGGVELFRLAPKMSGKLDAFLPGFSPDAVDQHVLDHHGPGRYSFRARIGAQYVAAQVFAFGDLDGASAASMAPTSRTTTPADELDPRQLMKEELEALQRDVELGRLADRRADQEQARLNRQLYPLQMMAIMKKLTADLGGPSTNGAVESATVKLLEKMLDQNSRQLEALEKRLEAAIAAKPSAPPSNTAADAVAQVRLLAEAAAALGFVRPGADAVPGTDVWDGISKVVSAAGPLADRALSIAERAVEAKTGAAPAPAGKPEALKAAGGESMAPQFDENTRAAISLALESLRSRDFDTVLHVITAVLIRPNGQPFIVLNPRVNPIAYMIQLKPFIPTIDDYRAEFAEFLKWFGDRLEEARLERERELQREQGEPDDEEE